MNHTMKTSSLRQLGWAVGMVALLCGPSVDTSTAQGTWSETGSMTRRRYGHTASLLSDGQVLVVGGSGPGAELYDPMTGRWRATGRLFASRRAHQTLPLTSGGAMAIGGTDSPATTEWYDPTTDVWTRGPDLVKWTPKPGQE
jgi:hypothetical protein